MSIPRKLAMDYIAFILQNRKDIVDYHTFFKEKDIIINKKFKSRLIKLSRLYGQIADDCKKKRFMDKFINSLKFAISNDKPLINHTEFYNRYIKLMNLLILINSDTSYRKLRLFRALNINKDLSTLIYKYDYHIEGTSKILWHDWNHTINCMISHGNKIITGLRDGVLRIWNLKDNTLEFSLSEHTKLITCIRILSDEEIITASEDFTLKIWNIITGKCISTLKGHTHKIYCVGILANKQIVSGSYDTTLRIWNSENTILKGHTDVIICMAIKESQIVSGSSDNTLRVWESGKCKFVLKGHSGSIHCVSILPNGQIVSGSSDNDLRIWDSGVCKFILTGHINIVYEMTILLDGRIISGSNDNCLMVWNPNTGKCESTLDGHGGSINSIDILPDGRILSGSEDHTMKIWNANTEECEVTLIGHSRPIVCAIILPDGRILSSSTDITLRLWE